MSTTNDPTNPQPATASQDEAFTAPLSELDDAVARGDTKRVDELVELNPHLADRLESGLTGLELLQQLRPDRPGSLASRLFAAETSTADATRPIVPTEAGLPAEWLTGARGCESQRYLPSSFETEESAVIEGAAGRVDAVEEDKVGCRELFGA